MGASIQSIIDVEVSLEDAPRLAERVHQLMVARGTIDPEPLGPRDEHGELRYQVRPPFPRASIGEELTIGVGYQFAHCFAGELGLYCHNCGRPNDLNMAWQVFESCHKRREPTLLTCRWCGYVAPLMGWITCPPFAVGHLAVAGRDSLAIDDDLRSDIAQLTGHRTLYLAYKF